MQKVTYLTIMCKTRAKSSGNMMIKVRPSGKVVVFTEEEVALIEAIMKEVSMVNFSKW